MGKYDHICELTGAENYSEWRRRMTIALQGAGLWSHCSDSTDPLDFLNIPSVKPVPADPTTLTDDEKEKILDWSAKDAQVKLVIDSKISPFIANFLLDETHTARQQWAFLAQYCSRNDVFSRYELHTRVRSEKLKDAEDATRYIGLFMS